MIWNIDKSDASKHTEYIDNHVFDFAEEGTIESAIFEDNIELLQQLLAVLPSETADKKLILEASSDTLLFSKKAKQIESLNTF